MKQCDVEDTGDGLRNTGDDPSPSVGNMQIRIFLCT